MLYFGSRLRIFAALPAPPATPVEFADRLAERARLEWYLRDGGDPAALLEGFLAAHGLPVADLSATGRCQPGAAGGPPQAVGAAVLVGAAAGACMSGAAVGAASPAPEVPDLVAVLYTAAEAPPPARPVGRFEVDGWTPTWSDAEHAAAVRAVRAEIAKGEVYQVNVVGHRSAPYRGDPSGALAAVATLPGASYGGMLASGAPCGAAPAGAPGGAPAGASAGAPAGAPAGAAAGAPAGAPAGAGGGAAGGALAGAAGGAAAGAPAGAAGGAPAGAAAGVAAGAPAGASGGAGGGAPAGAGGGASWAVASASPEALVVVAGGVARTSPVKGTRPATAAGRRALLASAKERAEHIMIVDLERNDLGRLAVPGTVRVESLFGLREWSGLWQAESTVAARLRPGTGLAALLRALLPGGSVTGAPKLAAVGLAAALEPVGRGPAMGPLLHAIAGR